jgi:hypothetical protein
MVTHANNMACFDGRSGLTAHVVAPDHLDHRAFPACMTGPGIPLPPGC